jgi:hypothetical protein
MSGGSEGTLTPGDYAVTTWERGIAIRREVKTLDAGSEVNIGLRRDPIRASIVRRSMAIRHARSSRF